MALFAKAVQKATQATTKAPAKKQTAWLVGQTEESQAVAKAVHELVTLESQKKALDSRANVFKTVVKSFAEKNFVKDYADCGVPPETPMVVQNDQGEKVTYVVQDRSTQYAVKQDQQDALTQLLGQDRAAQLLYTDTTFGLNPLILSIPGVSEAVEKALERAVKNLTESKVLTTEQAELLLDVEQKTTFKPQTMGKLVEICGKDTTRIKQFLEIAGSSCTRYIKP